MTLPDPPILVITDRRMADRPMPAVIDAVLDAGCRWILLREKDLPPEELLALADQLVLRCARRNARLSVSADIAAAERAGGLHLPQSMADAATMRKARRRLGPQAPIGVSAHSRREAETAQRLGADYVTMSPVFLTDSKPGYGPALGLDGLAAETAAAAIPVVALGGISAADAASVRAAGAAGIAVMGSVMRTDDPGRVVAELIAAWRG